MPRRRRTRPRRSSRCPGYCRDRARESRAAAGANACAVESYAIAREDRPSERPLQPRCGHRQCTRLHDRSGSRVFDAGASARPSPRRPSRRAGGRARRGLSGAARCASSCRFRPAAPSTDRCASSRRNSASASGSRSSSRTSRAPARRSAPTSSRRRRRTAIRCCSRRRPTRSARRSMRSCRSTRSSDFTPVTLIGREPGVVVVNPAVPAKTLQEFIAYVKAHPGRSITRRRATAAASICSPRCSPRAPGMKMNHVPYRGSGQATTDLLSGVVSMAIPGTAGMVGHIKAGKLRALAVTGAYALAAAARRADGDRVGRSGLRGVRLDGIARAEGHAAGDRRAPQSRRGRRCSARTT